jgi:hypothetical protein
MSRCFLKSFAPAGMRECSGPVQGHHVIRQQTIKRAIRVPNPFETDAVIRAQKREIAWRYS